MPRDQPPPAEPHSARRQRRFKLAVLTSLASKVAGALAMLITLPLVLKGLGDARFAAFLAFTAATQWISPLGLGIMPSLTRELSVSATLSDNERERILFGLSFWMVAGLASLALAAGLAIALGPDPRALLGLKEEALTLTEARLGFATALGLVAVNLFATLSTAVRAGYQESHVSNLLSLAANLCAVATVALLSRGSHGVAAYIAALQAPLILLLLLDIGRIARARPHLWPPFASFRQGWEAGYLRTLLATSTASWAFQVSFFLIFFLSVVLVSRAFGIADTNAYGTMMRALILGNAVISLFAWPIIPALAEAARRGDLAWARKGSLRLLGFTFAAAAIGATLIALSGPAAVVLWMGSEVRVDPTMALGFAMLFLGYNMSFVGYTLCMGLGIERRVALLLLVEVAMAGCAALLLAPQLGAPGVAIALGLVSLAGSGWILPVRVVRHVWLRKDSA